MLSTFTKVSAMMTGELEANEIIKRDDWIANVLLIIFEGATVILLMNLMISLAVGDVKELRDSAEDRIVLAKFSIIMRFYHIMTR
uniref:Uncharacterized protein n=1 Tax=Panagrolaimus sp. PS1159 TaxID=55785 RepID=A0AC35F8S1_9BILA